MFNNINSNGSWLFQSESQIGNASNIVNLAAIRANLQKNGYSTNSCVDTSEISSNAMKLFQRDLDINKFTKIAISDEDDLSHLDIMQKLFDEGIIDVGEDDVLSKLVTNEKLQSDLDL